MIDWATRRLLRSTSTRRWICRLCGVRETALERDDDRAVRQMRKCFGATLFALWEERWRWAAGRSCCYDAVMRFDEVSETKLGESWLTEFEIGGSRNGNTPSEVR